MEKKDKSLRNDLIYFNLLVIVILIAILFTLTISSYHGLFPFVMISLFVSGLVVGYNLGILPALMYSLGFVFIYGSYLLYNIVVTGQIVDMRADYFIWFIVLPIGTYISGLYRAHNNRLLQEAGECKFIDEFITLDKDTGFLNEAGFFIELNNNIEKSNKFSIPLSIMVIKVNNIPELRALYGKDGVQEILKAIAMVISKIMFAVDSKGLVELGVFGLILPGAEEDNLNLVEKKVENALNEISVTIRGDTKKVKLNFLIGRGTYKKGEEGYGLYAKAFENAKYHIY